MTWLYHGGRSMRVACEGVSLVRHHEVRRIDMWRFWIGRQDPLTLIACARDGPLAFTTVVV